MANEHTKSVRGGWLFLLLVVAVYGVIAISNVELIGQALNFFVKAMRSVWPVLIIVFLLLLAADMLLKPAWIKRHLGGKGGIKGWLIVAMAGVLASGPIYAWYALLKDLREKGMRASLAAVFLYSRAIKLPLLPLMVHYFGGAYTVVFCLYLFAFSIVSGLLMIRIKERETT
ncbi:MAG: permease [Gammaproteobacteria bacterium]